MNASIHDVARKAGVSPRTVSNVVNDFVHVRPETRARVKAAIDELRYRPNISARRLRQGNTRTIALAVPELSQPYFAELIDFVERAAQDRDYTVIAAQTGGTRARERETLSYFGSHIVDGIILSPLAISEDDLLELRPTVPVVLIGEQISTTEFASVAIDNERALFEVTTHLIGSGRRRIAALGAHRDPSYRSARLRLDGYRRALTAAGLPLDDKLTLVTDEYSRRAGYDAVLKLLASGTELDGIVCFNDVLAIGALRALADKGRHVPKDIAVTGVDDIDDARYCVPSLTTISPDKGAIATNSVLSLLGLIEARSNTPVSIEHAFQLVMRESSASR